MSQRKTIGWMAVLLAAFLVSAFAGAYVTSDPSPQSAEELYQAALLKKEAEGDLGGAIKLFQSIIVKFPDNKDVAAKAQLQIGACYEKLGKAEAIKAYELVVERYSGQKEQVAAARARLADLKREPAKGLSIVKFGNWDKPGIYIQPVEISPDGTTMVGVEFIKGQNIVVCDLKTNQVKYITDHTWDMKGYYYTYNPVLSPDGKEIVYSSLASFDKEDAAKNSLIAATLNGGSRILASDKTEWHIPNAWLPDGSAVLTIKGGPGHAPQLGLVPRGGGDFKTLASFQNEKIEAGREQTSASVSPDGQYVVYTDTVPGEKSDIYIVSSKGGAPKPLIRHPAEEKFPRWSPDGKNVVFLSLRHGSWALWGLSVKAGDAAGEPFLIRDGMKDSILMNWTAGGLASWDGMMMNDIFLMGVDPATGEPTGDPRQLEYAPTGGNGTPAWSPDGKSFAFLRTGTGPGAPSVVVSGTSMREFPMPAAHGMGFLRWTPDGSRVGIILADETNKWFLHQLNVVSGTWKKIPVPVEMNAHFDWSASGNAILLAKPGPVEKGGGIVEFNLETGAERYVYRPKKEFVSVIRWLDSSRDNKRLAFLQVNSSAAALELIVVNLETGESHTAAPDFGYSSWSPDGRKIIGDRALSPKGSKQSLFIVPEAGGPVKEIDLGKRLPPRSEIRTPDWSPDGKKIIFTLRSSISEVSLLRNVIPPDK
jgi:Tol biopolymer transport system component